MHLRNGAYALIEVKLGGRLLIEEGVKTLTRLDALIRAKKAPPRRLSKWYLRQSDSLPIADQRTGSWSARLDA